MRLVYDVEDDAAVGLPAEGRNRHAQIPLFVERGLHGSDAAYTLERLVLTVTGLRDPAAGD